jgi:hypothetical protein
MAMSGTGLRPPIIDRNLSLTGQSRFCSVNCTPAKPGVYHCELDRWISGRRQWANQSFDREFVDSLDVL